MLKGAVVLTENIHLMLRFSSLSITIQQEVLQPPGEVPAPASLVDLLHRMLEFDPNRRLTVHEALNHEFLQ